MKQHALFFNNSGDRIEGPSSVLPLSAENSNAVNLILAEDHARKLHQCGPVVALITINEGEPGTVSRILVSSFYAPVAEIVPEVQHLNLRPFLSDLCRVMEDAGFHLRGVEHSNGIWYPLASGSARDRRQDVKALLLDKKGEAFLKVGFLVFTKDGHETKIRFDFNREPEAFFASMECENNAFQAIEKIIRVYREKVLDKVNRKA
jgi:hypothetical protein